CAHRHLRRARRGPVPDHRRARPPAGRARPAGAARRVARPPRPRQHPGRTPALMAQTPKKTTTRKAAAPRRRATPDKSGLAELKFTIESAFERRAALTPDEIEGSTRPLVERVIDGLERGEFRVAEPDGA